MYVGPACWPSFFASAQMTDCSYRWLAAYDPRTFEKRIATYIADWPASSTLARSARGRVAFALRRPANCRGDQSHFPGCLQPCVEPSTLGEELAHLWTGKVCTVDVGSAHSTSIAGYRMTSLLLRRTERHGSLCRSERASKLTSCHSVRPGCVRHACGCCCLQIGLCGHVTYALANLPTQLARLGSSKRIALGSVAIVKVAPCGRLAQQTGRRQAGQHLMESTQARRTDVEIDTHMGKISLEQHIANHWASYRETLSPPTKSVPGS